jgi:hypothetical protein
MPYALIILDLARDAQFVMAVRFRPALLVANAVPRSASITSERAGKVTAIG